MGAEAICSRRRVTDNMLQPGVAVCRIVRQLAGRNAAFVQGRKAKLAKLLISFAPAGLEEMFVEFGVPVAQGATTPHRLWRQRLKSCWKLLLGTGSRSGCRATAKNQQSFADATFEFFSKNSLTISAAVKIH